MQLVNPNRRAVFALHQSWSIEEITTDSTADRTVNAYFISLDCHFSIDPKLRLALRNKTDIAVGYEIDIYK